MKILHDIHTHNVMSLCCGDPNATTENYIREEERLGMKIFGLSNHIWDERVKGCSEWYGAQTIRRSLECKSAMKLAAPKNLRCLFGAEAEYYGCYDRLGMTVEGAQNFDYMLVAESHLHMKNEVMWDYPEVIEARRSIYEKVKKACPELADDDVARMTDVLREWRLMKLVPEMKTDIKKFVVEANLHNFNALMENETFLQICRRMPTSVAHPLCLGCLPRDLKNECRSMIDDNTLRACFAKAKKAGAYIEINISELKGSEPDLSKNGYMRYFRIAKEVGCQFTFGTDAHAVNALQGVVNFGGEICELLGLTKNDFAEFVRDSIEEEL